LNYQYRTGNSPILRADCIKDLGVYIDSKLHFHQHVDFLFSHTMKLLWLIRTITFSFSILDSLLMLYIATVRSKLEYASVVWNSITNTYSSKLEHIQRKFAALCHSRFFQDVDYHYINILDKLNLHTLHVKRRHTDALFLINVFRGTKFCPLDSKQSACVFLLGTSENFPRSVVLPATVLQPGVFLLQIQFVNL
jgi:hypothetical protein